MAPAPSARRASNSSARIQPSRTTSPTSISEASPTGAILKALSLISDSSYVSSNLNPAGAAPLLCAGITTYSPMRHWGVTKGKKVGVVGLGGLGHMGVNFAHALGAHTVVFTTSAHKKEDALRLGADEVVHSRHADEMQKHAGSFDFILDCVSANHDIHSYINLLRRDGTIALVGAPEKPLAVPAFGLIMGRRSLAGSPIGGIVETQEMLDFCDSTTSRPTSKSFRSRRSTKPTRDCSSQT